MNQYPTKKITISNIKLFKLLKEIVLVVFYQSFIENIN